MTSIEWYQQGSWPLFGAVLSIIISNTISVSIVFLQSKKAFATIVRQRELEFLVTALNDFYNPLLALIDINQEIFEKTGPPSFPRDEIRLGAAAIIWEEMKQKILENNKEIEIVLKSKTHLIDESDSLQEYHALMMHVAMYEAFQRAPTDIYKSFLFPTGVRNHIYIKRTVVLRKLNDVKGK